MRKRAGGIVEETKQGRYFLDIVCWLRIFLGKPAIGTVTIDREGVACGPELNSSNELKGFSERDITR
jgi:hypothetical protein